uniref:ATP synthase subunit a n=1 Tax=Mycopsylla proxima TaxID=1681221 RepID=A0A343UQT3_9HEMI|nr:ATP synthase F0 subunit 6 [Mycopsylla proxima]AVF97058.1 ATP synthase F0 subunit 6 [Mycopsylla proxima]
MMMSLFSMFDPSTIFLQFNWMLMLICMFFFPFNFWIKKSRILNMITLINKYLHNEFKMLFTKSITMKGSTIIFITLFYFIMFNNILSNFPYTFCCSAHLVFSLSISFPIWLAIMVYSWINLTKFMFSHLLPNGTPIMLMPMMVMIETTSNLIRPLALSIRLSANLIAGHLLMNLMGNNFNFNKPYWMMMLLIQILFLSFEFMIGMIQSYVFSILMTLYSSEIN